MTALEATTISAGIVPVVLETVAASGAAVEPLLQATQLGVQALSDPDARISHARMRELFEAAEALTRDPVLGLRVAARLRPGTFGLFELLLRNSPTIADVFVRARRYQRLLQDADLDLDTCRRGVAQVYRLRSGAALPRAIAECTIAGAAIWMRQMSGRNVDPVEVCFAHGPGADPDTYAALLRAPVRFWCEENAIVFPAEVLAWPLPMADPEHVAELEATARARLDGLPSDVALPARVRALIAAELHAGAPRLARVARRAHMSERTLRRRLAEHGTTYRRLLDELRCERAARYRRASPLSLEEIAVRLRLHDASALRKALRRWNAHLAATRCDRPDRAW